MASGKAAGERRWELVRWYVREGRFRIEERTLTAFQWLYSPQQHRIVSRADLGSPSSSSFAPRSLKALKYLSAWNCMDENSSGRVAAEDGWMPKIHLDFPGQEGLWVLFMQGKPGGVEGRDIHTWDR